MASTFADEVAALRGTRPATLKDLVTNAQFSKLLIAQTASSFGDWVGFVAVAALVSAKGGAVGQLRRRRRDGRADAAGDPVRSPRGRVRRPVQPEDPDGERRHRARQHVRADAVPRSAVGDLHPVVRDRVLLAPVDAVPRRVPAQPGSAAPARERQLPRAHHDLRDAPARRARLRLPVGRLGSDPLAQGQSGVPGALAGRRHVRAVGDAGLADPDAQGRPDRLGALRALDRSDGTSPTACGSCARARSPPR